jgi:hypothetical protein
MPPLHLLGALFYQCSREHRENADNNEPHALLPAAALQCFTAPGFGRTTTLAGTQTVVAVIEW